MAAEGGRHHRRSRRRWVLLLVAAAAAAGAGLRRGLPPRLALRLSDEVRVYEQNPPLLGAPFPESPTVVLSANSHPEVLRALKSAGPFDRGDCYCLPRWRLDLFRRGRPIGTLWIKVDGEMVGAAGGPYAELPPRSAPGHAGWGLSWGRVRRSECAGGRALHLCR